MMQKRYICRCIKIVKFAHKSILKIVRCSYILWLLSVLTAARKPCFSIQFSRPSSHFQYTLPEMMVFEFRCFFFIKGAIFLHHGIYITKLSMFRMPIAFWIQFLEKITKRNCLEETTYFLTRSTLKNKVADLWFDEHILYTLKGIKDFCRVYAAYTTHETSDRVVSHSLIKMRSACLYVSQLALGYLQRVSHIYFSLSHWMRTGRV